MSKAIYNLLAGVFTYPDEDFQRTVERVVGALQEVCPTAAGPLGEFHDLLPFHSQDDPLLVMQEIYTRSFDVQAITTLDLGYVVFGDDYKRGELLVNLMEELVQLIVAPALRQMVGQFAPDRLEQKEKLYRKHHRTVIETAPNRYAMYGLAFRSVYFLLQRDFELPDVDAPAEGTVDFADTVGQELEIEKDEGGPLGGCQSGDVVGQAKGIPGSC